MRPESPTPPRLPCPMRAAALEDPAGGPEESTPCRGGGKMPAWGDLLKKPTAVLLAHGTGKQHLRYVWSRDGHSFMPVLGVRMLQPGGRGYPGRFQVPTTVLVPQKSTVEGSLWLKEIDKTYQGGPVGKIYWRDQDEPEFPAPPVVTSPL